MASRRTRTSFERLTVLDITDREILLAITELADKDGMVIAGQIADYFGVTSNGKRTPAGTVSNRLSWMKRYGYVDRVDPRSLGLKRSDHPRYVLTPFGEQVARAKLTNTLGTWIESSNEGQAVVAMRALAARAFTTGGGLRVANAVRREYRFHENRRPR